eukprot:TRINITY_DN66083_c9_g6_i1.p1 TRINITY_DN66083_c9_g6~~TRINITY_DN66083_c9_g6_i1.p1  ORF type:complete len:196 (+),score=105.52 TRINITY_DN66083_c9_g6_i1:46-633(+)
MAIHKRVLATLLVSCLLVASCVVADEQQQDQQRTEKQSREQVIEIDESPQPPEKEVDVEESESTFATLLSCSGCRLNRLPQIKKFIRENAREYPALQVKYVGGDPRIKFVTGRAEQKTLTFDTSKMTEDEILAKLKEAPTKTQNDETVDISEMSVAEVRALLKEHNVLTTDELEQRAAAANKTGKDESADKKDEL